MGKSHKSRKGVYYLYLKIALASLIIASLTAYGLQIGKRLGYNYLPLIDASMEIKLEITNAHLWLEEILSGDRDKDIEIVRSSLAKADWYVTAMLEGGENNEEKFIPIEDKTLRITLTSIQTKLIEFKRISELRYNIRDGSEPGTEIDRQFDRVFHEIVAVTDKAETYLQSLYQKELFTFRIIQVALMLSYIILAMWVAYILNRYEATKRRDFDALNNIKESLDEELSCRKNIETALRESETRYRNLIESADDVIFTLSREGKILSLNRAFEKITGWHRKEWIGKSYEKLIHPEDLEVSGKALIDSFEGKTVPTHELRIMTKKGDYLVGEFRISVIVDNKGRVSILGIARDIMERKRIQKALDQTEKKYRTLIENLPIGAFRSTVDGKVLSANPALVNMLGYESADEYKDIPAQVSYLNPERRDIFIDELKKTGRVENYESQMVRKDGSVIWVSSSVHAVHDEDGKIIYFDGIERDITERKRIETEQNILFDISRLYLTSEKSESFYNEIAEMLTTRLQFPISFIELLDEEKGEMVIMGSSGFEPDKTTPLRLPIEKSPSGEVVIRGIVSKQNNLGPQSCHHIDSLNNSEIKSLVSVPIKMRHEIIGTLSVASPFDRILNDSLVRSLKVIADFIGLIIDRSHTEDALMQSESNFQELFNSVTEGIGIVDENEVVRFCNPAYVQLFEEDSIEKVIGKSLLEYIPDGHKQFLQKQTNRRKQNTSSQYEMEIITAKNNLKTVYASVSPRFDSDGNYIGAFGAVFDITDLKRAEEEIRKFKAISDNASFGVIITDSEGDIQYTNKSFASMHGYPDRDVLNRNINIFLSQHELEKFRDAITNLMKSGNFESLEFNHTHADGRSFATLMNGVVIKGRGGHVKNVALFTTDISSTKQLQEFAERAKRLESAGRIAGQVAHDFNNLLGPLLAYPELMKDELPSNHPVLEMAEAMESAAAQIAAINQQLLTLSRRGHYNLEPINLNDIINRVLDQNTEIIKGIYIETLLEKGLNYINGGESQIFRVLSNLISNATDAIINRGKISIKSENWYTDSYSGRLTKIPKGDYVKITIYDTGCGIPENIISKIFEPFFSTKAADKKKGSGLGLSVVHNVVTDHNGFIDIQSSEEKGTIFYLYFPALKEVIIKRDNDEVIGGGEKILIIDDDDLQREVTSRLLRKLGYYSSSAGSGEEAIEILKKESSDLLIIDMVMPNGMDGTKTLKEALKINPHQKAIIVSGFSESNRVKKALELGAGTFVKKPLLLKTLANAVRKELDRKIETPSKHAEAIIR
ncbi:MAG: PAS domain S-box protein [candidate division Zixibacteria bacterium]